MMAPRTRSARLAVLITTALGLILMGAGSGFQDAKIPKKGGQLAAFAQLATDLENVASLLL
jgi:hypothetical protein